MKKKPMHQYEHKNGLVSIVGTTAEESALRTQAWIRTGCNAFSKGTSKPLSFWTNQDILTYIKQNNLPIASVYGDIVSVDSKGNAYTDTLCDNGSKLKCSGCQRTGCAYCLFGAQSDKGKSRFELLKETHPKIYDYCLRGGQWSENPFYDANAPKVEKDGWVNFNPKKIWTPSADGLGMKFVIDSVNKLYGKNFIKY